MRTTTLLCAALFIGAIALGCSDATQSSSPFPPHVTAEVDRTVEQMIADGMSPGAMVTVATPKGTWTRAYGVADVATGAPMEADLLFRIGSVTKTFTVTLLLMLVDEGRLGLDDTIATYLEGVPNGDRITLRMMAGMTSGLPNYTENEDFVAAVKHDWAYDWAPDQLLGFAYAQPFLFPPGTSLHYSNTNTVLLGQLIEMIEQKPIADVFRERIFAPLGLDGTSWPSGLGFPGPYVHGYSDLNEEETIADASHWSPSEAHTAGAIISTLADVRVWTRALARGDLLTPETQRQRLTWPDVGGNTAERHYALGIFGIDGWIGHDGDIPGYNTYAMHEPDLDATLVVMTNADTPYQGVSPAAALVKTVSDILFPGHGIDALSLPEGARHRGLRRR
jgi:D-alanyl-D-alanine carboxypeptidase